MIALTFALAYQFVAIDLGGRPDNWMTSIYFSFVTLTTLGYGDIVPISPFARTLSITEALIGSFFIAILIAKLVGLGSGSLTRISPRKISN